MKVNDHWYTVWSHRGYLKVFDMSDLGHTPMLEDAERYLKTIDALYAAAKSKEPITNIFRIDVRRARGSIRLEKTPVYCLTVCAAPKPAETTEV